MYYNMFRLFVLIGACVMIVFKIKTTAKNSYQTLFALNCCSIAHY
jgi:hypothetical protein